MAEIRLSHPVRLFAPAKINLGLEVVGQRKDGYHEIVTVLQTISLFDELIVTPSTRSEFLGDSRIALSDDLVFRAVKVFEERLGVSIRARIRVEKRIPISSGLGGGSSDAATMLATLCLLSDVDIQVGENLASELGSDIPFFIRGGTAIATGTGTAMEQLPDLCRSWFVLATPDVQIPDKTASLYGSLRHRDLSDGSATRNMATELRKSLSVSHGLMRNSFSRALYQIPEVNDARQKMLESGARFVLPSGAGPTLFTMTDTWDEARQIAKRIRNSGIAAVICTNVSSNLNISRLRQILA